MNPAASEPSTSWTLELPKLNNCCATAALLPPPMIGPPPPDVIGGSVTGSASATGIPTTAHRHSQHAARRADPVRRPSEISELSIELLSAESVATGESLAENQLVHLRCALVSQHRLQVHHVPDYRVFQRYPVATQYRSSGPADLDRLTGVVELAEAHLLGTQPHAVLEAPQV